MIPFNKPYLSGSELEFIADAIASGHISGDGKYTKKCHDFIENRYKVIKALLTNSCTDALEMTAILADICPGDEVILPSFTFVSTANAFILRGAKLVFADSEDFNPNINVEEIEKLINKRTKAVVVVHYAGIACNMEPVLKLANKYGLIVIEDAAQAIDSFYEGKQLGTIGSLGTFSFHETKNVMCGEGGMLLINDNQYIKRAEIIREKGTNRSSFFRGEIDKYGWVDIGSSFLPSDVSAAFLFAQLLNIDKIQKRRIILWQLYHDNLMPLHEYGLIKLPFIPEFATNNAHMFYFLCKNLDERNRLIDFLKIKGIHSVFHYLPLHLSPYFKSKHDGRILNNAQTYADTLLRLPLFFELKEDEIMWIVDCIIQYYTNKNDV